VCVAPYGALPRRLAPGGGALNKERPKRCPLGQDCPNLAARLGNIHKKIPIDAASMRCSFVNGDYLRQD
jgi:hypothetical protein